MKTISTNDANRNFANVLRTVASGEVITVLSQGKPVATISPAHAGACERTLAKLDLLRRLRQQMTSSSRDWSRDELYED